MRTRRLPHVSAEAQENIFDTLATLLASGMDLNTALRAIADELKQSSARTVVRAIQSEVEAGSPMWRACERARLASPETVALLRVGEIAGRLPENLAVVAAQQQKRRQFRSKIRSAAAYPAVVLGLAMVVGLGIAWFILPRLATVFSSLRVPLPPLTRALIAVGTFFRTAGPIVVPLFILVVTSLVVASLRIPRWRAAWQGFALRVPGISTLLKQVELARFGFVLGSLLDAGLPVVEALNALAGAIPNRPYRRIAERLRADVADGNSFQKSFARMPELNRYIPSSVQQLIVAGEHSGRLAEAFRRVGEAYEAKVDVSAKNLSAVLEPILLFVVWIGVMLVAIAVILPIYSLTGNILPS